MASQLHRTKSLPGLALSLSLSLLTIWTVSQTASVGSTAQIQLSAGLDNALAYIGHPSAQMRDSFPSGFKTGFFGLCLSGGTFLLVETVMLLMLELMPQLTSQFAARKICHSGTGLLMLTLDSHNASARAAVWIIGVSSILMTWNVIKAIGIQPFRFGAERDVGITIYLMLVILWFYSELPPAALSPMFFADPAGAVVGKNLVRFGFKNPAWYEKKTVGGSTAVFTLTLLTLIAFYPPMPMMSLVLLSASAFVVEAIGGQYDNLCLAAAVIGGYWCLSRL